MPMNALGDAYAYFMLRSVQGLDAIKDPGASFSITHRLSTSFSMCDARQSASSLHQQQQQQV